MFLTGSQSNLLMAPARDQPACDRGMTSSGSGPTGQLGPPKQRCRIRGGDFRFLNDAGGGAQVQDRCFGLD